MSAKAIRVAVAILAVEVALIVALVTRAEDDVIGWESIRSESPIATVPFWEQPECPDDFGPITLWMPPGWGYDTIKCECCRAESPEEE